MGSNETAMIMPVLSHEDRLKQLDVERKELKAKVAEERKNRKSKNAGIRKLRDSEIEHVNRILKQVRAKILAYNKLGKNAKMGQPILEEISLLVDEAEDDDEMIPASVPAPEVEPEEDKNPAL